MLHNAILQQILAKTGFSFDAITGQSPTDGYMVSIPTFRKPIDLTDYQTNAAVQQDIHNAIEDVWAEAQAIKGFVGGWVGDDGLYYLDASVNAGSAMYALRLGKIWDQQAIYDVKNQVCIDLK